jgi:hypothetical protein
MGHSEAHKGETTRDWEATGNRLSQPTTTLYPSELQNRNHAVPARLELTASVELQSRLSLSEDFWAVTNPHINIITKPTRSALHYNSSVIIKADGAISQQPSASVLKIRCPVCLQRGTFEPLGTYDYLIHNQGVYVGARRCPDPLCQTLIFFAFRGGQLIISYPAERIDFDATNIPPSVRSALEEAISCHANQCFIASAIMVRKTLEELCRDRGATGDNLKARIKALGTKVVLPAELLEGLDDLRLLGNDAAHIESREYDQVGQEEVEVGIEFTKEVLKAVYQYSALLNRLRGLKKTP